MKKNLRSCMEQQDFGEPECLLDMNDYGLITAGGLTPDLRHKKSAHMSAAWSFAAATEVRIPLPVSDLSGYRWLTFSVFAAAGQGGSFRLRFESDAEQGKAGKECRQREPDRERRGVSEAFSKRTEDSGRGLDFGYGGIRASFFIRDLFYTVRQGGVD